MQSLPFLLLLLPLIAIGSSYQLSVGTLIIAGLLGYVMAYGRLVITKHYLLLLSSLFVLMSISCLGYPGLESWHLQMLRIGFQFLLIAATSLVIRSIHTIPRNGTSEIHRKTKSLTTITAMILLGIVIMQSMSILATGSNAINVPAEWFAISRPDFVPDARRPLAFFPEPSYAGFVLTSLGAINVLSIRSVKLSVILLSAAALCQTLSGIIAVIAIHLPLYIAQWSPRRLALGISLAAGLTAIIAFAPGDQLRILDRVIAKNNDESLNVRLVNPWIAISYIWQNDPLGVQRKAIDEYASKMPPPIGGSGLISPDSSRTFQYRPAFIDNGFLNFFIFHGVLGIPILILLCFAFQLKGPVAWILIFCIAQFNGDLLSPDRLGAFCLAMTIGARCFRPSSQTGMVRLIKPGTNETLRIPVKMGGQ